MGDSSPGRGAERAEEAATAAASAQQQQASPVAPAGAPGTSGNGQAATGEGNAGATLPALAWTGERRVKKPKKKKLLAEAIASAAATTTSTSTPTAPPAVSGSLAASVYGPGARASVELRRERSIRLEDVQSLLLWVLGEGSSPRWAFVKNKALIDRVLLVSVPGLGESLWGPVQRKGREGGEAEEEGERRDDVVGNDSAPLPPSRARALLPSLASLGEPLSCIARTPDLRPAQAMDLLFTVPRATTTADKQRRRQNQQQQQQPHAKRKREEAEEGEEEGGYKEDPRRRRVSNGGGDVSGGVAATTTKASTTEAATQPTTTTPPPPRPTPRPPFHPPHLPPPHHYTLTREAMIAREYPVPHVTPEGHVLCPPGFVTTRPKGKRERGEKADDDAAKGTTLAPASAPTPPPPNHPHLVAIDCEMCETEQGFELARVSAVAPDGAVLVDELVRPPRRVVNYHTRFSGITPEKLSGVETTLEQAREMLLEHVHEETVLVGHALENDLRALRLLHARVVDTGVLYPHPAGPPYRTALRNLSYKFLRRTIQADDHDSVDDARAAMDLALLKFSRGPAFGATPLPGVGGVYSRGERLLKVLSESGRRCTLVDRPDAVNRHVSGAASGIPAGTDGERASRAAREVASGGGGGSGGSKSGGVNFVWTQLTALATLQQSRADAKRSLISRYAEAAEKDRQARGGDDERKLPPLFDGCDGSDAADIDDAFELETTLRQIDAQLDSLISAAPPNTLVVVVTCHGDTAETRRLQEQAWRRAQGLDHLPKWSLQAETHLAAVRSAGMRGLCFCSVKQ